MPSSCGSTPRDRDGGNGGGGGGGGIAPATIRASFKTGLTPQQVDAELRNLANERERIEKEWQQMLISLANSLETQPEFYQRMEEINAWHEDAIERINEINRKYGSEYGVSL